MNRAMRIILSILAVVLIARLAHLRAGVGAIPEGGDAVVTGGANGGALLAAGAAIGTLLLGAWLTGKLVSLIGLPKITGYLIFGLVAGPYGIEAITKSQLDYLTLINSFAVSLIALTAGGEIDLRLLRKDARRISVILACMVTLLLVTIGGVSAATLGPFAGLEFPTGSSLLAAALLIAVVATSNSPAAVIAVVTEMRAKGPLSRTALSVVVCTDLILIVLFAAVSSFVVRLLPVAEATAEQGAGSVWSVAWHLGGSLVMGGVTGLVLAFFLSRVRKHRALIVIFTCFGIAVVAGTLHLEPLITALVAGLLVENLWHEQAEQLFDETEELSIPVYAMFFSLAGAKIDPGVLMDTWPMALTICLIRAASIYAGTTLAGRLTKQPSPGLWLAFLPQAGVSIALAIAAAQTLTPLGPIGATIFTVLLAAITCNEIVGPALFKFALVRAGEARPQRA